MKKLQKTEGSETPAGLVLLSEAHKKLMLPGSPGPINKNSLYQFMKKLKIEAVRKQRDGEGYHYAYITADQAKILEEDFKRVHWRKFARAKAKKK